jgi:hypothetical protein
MAGGPRTLVGRGVAHLSFPPPERGVWRAEMTRDLDCSQILPEACYRLGGDPWPTGPTHLYGMRLANRRATCGICPLSRFSVPGEAGAVPQRRCSRGRSGAGLRLPPASTASRPIVATSREDAPRWTGRIDHSQRVAGSNTIHYMCKTIKCVLGQSLSSIVTSNLFASSRCASKSAGPTHAKNDLSPHLLRPAHLLSRGRAGACHNPGSVSDTR